MSNYMHNKCFFVNKSGYPFVPVPELGVVVTVELGLVKEHLVIVLGLFSDFSLQHMWVITEAFLKST